ncbi:MAG TPA: cytochrome c [Terriglobales bacterium]|jgi:mono/diheme cytochrome c family protein|nr:cytochrome c [Terriglobales bacterium]
MKMFELALAAFSLSLAVAAQNPPSGLTANPVYQKNCAKCHGKTAEGRHFGGPSLFSDKPAADLRTIIADGKHRMPKYADKLKADEIDTLVQQIAALKK